MNSATVRSVGPGAAGDIMQRVRTLPQMEAIADPAAFEPPDYRTVSYDRLSDEVQRMIKSIMVWQGPRQNREGTVFSPEDPTWGFTLMVTAYDSVSEELLPRALENWIAVLDRQLRFHSYTLPVWADEAMQRLRLEVLQDPVLDQASEDRVKARFRDLLRERRLLNQNDQPPPPGRNMACILLDASTIAKMADLTVPEYARAWENFTQWEQIRVQFLDVFWPYPGADEDEEDEYEEDDEDDEDAGPYRGNGQLSVSALASFYNRLTSAAHGGVMREMHPLDGFPP